MKEHEYEKLRFTLMKKYMEILEVEQQFNPLLKDKELNKDKIVEIKEKTNYEQLQADFKQLKKEWEQLLENTEITKENYQFIKFSKAVLGQFVDNKDEIHDIIFKELHKLVESKSPAEQIKNYVSPEVVKQKMIGLVAHL